jgi:hypothetical protein
MLVKIGWNSANVEARLTRRRTKHEILHKHGFDNNRQKTFRIAI